MGRSRGRLSKKRPAQGACIPETDAEGFFGIRLESIGGLGAHLAGRILAEAVVLRQGLNGSHFSSYGSEKKGSPLKSFVRFCASDREVRTSSPIENPQVVAVFHEALARAADVTAGLSPTGAVIVNTRSKPDAMREVLGLATGQVAVVDALGIAVEEKTRVNTAMLGAITRVCQFIDPEAVRETIRQTFLRRYSHLVEANLRTFDRGYEELRSKSYRGDAREAPAPQRNTPAYGYLEAPVGGALLTPGSTISRDHTVSRDGFIPVYDAETCVHCGLCDLVCPDFCFVWEEEERGGERPAVRLRGIDYRYCKGCLKCIEVCPTNSLTEQREEEGYADTHRVPLFAWLDQPVAKRKARTEGRGRKR